MYFDIPSPSNSEFSDWREFFIRSIYYTGFGITSSQIETLKPAFSSRKTKKAGSFYALGSGRELTFGSFKSNRCFELGVSQPVVYKRVNRFLKKFFQTGL